MAVKCTGLKPDGTPCAAWAIRGSDPPRCNRHPLEGKAKGAPKGNKNAQKHGAYAADPDRDPADLETRIADLAAKIDKLSRYIDDRFDGLEPNELKGLMSLYGQLNSRLGRLKRDQRTLSAESGEDDEIARLMEEALGRFWAEWDAEADGVSARDPGADSLR